jgi:hypothetical protein
VALDRELEEAIGLVVAECGQPPQVAQRLIAWARELSEAELGMEDQLQHLDNVRKALKLPGDSDAD